MADIDWNEIKVEYVTGNISLKKLAEKHGLSPYTVENKSRKERWSEERRKYGGKVTANAIARNRARESNRLASLQKAGASMCNQLERLMRDGRRQLYTHVGTDKDGEMVEKRLETVDDRKLLNITRSIETMARAMQALYATQEADKGKMEIEIRYSGVKDMEEYLE